MPTFDLPFRLSERCFREYELDIKTIVELSPARAVLPPRPGRSQATVEARLRDAMRSLYEYRWSPTKVDMVKFDQLYPRFIVRRDIYDASNVAVEFRGEPRPDTPQRTATDSIVIPTSCASDLAVQTYCAVLAAKGLATFKLTGLTRSTLDPSLAHYDIGLVEKDDAVYII